MTNDEELPSVVNSNTAVIQALSGSPAISMVNNAVSGIMIGSNANGVINLVLDPSQSKEILLKLSSDILGKGQPITEVPAVNHALEWDSLSREKFNIFVLENEEFNCGVFSMSKAKSMELYTNTEDYHKYRMLSPDAISDLCSMPCIFAKRNRYYNRNDDSHPAFLGKIKNIKNQGDIIKFEFEAFQTISQQTLNENVILLGIAYASLRNEFDEEHWSIKRGNLLLSLANLGIEVR